MVAWRACRRYPEFNVWENSMAHGTAIPFYSVAFPNHSTIFIRPVHHREKMEELTVQIIDKTLEIQGMSLSTAAAWSMACELYSIPAQGSA